MKYLNIKKGKFISRPNRFIAHIEIDGRKEICHVKNTGRCKELLLSGATVFVQESDKAERKTKYDLISVLKGDMLINMDSQAPNKVMEEWLPKYFENITLIKPEAKYKNSRFDFYLEADGKKIFAEVKGVTLEENGVVMFPDAPTERGVKHLNELCECVKDGYEAYVFFVVQIEKADYFTPNRKTHPEFADALINAQKCGVNVYCINCIVKEDELTVKDFLKIIL
ncbi:MAG: DNA/RNA nuclease SfsA [Ruminococcaceae bacterium]|nr:DNA/RNA nuclease SfsA [Oscillospiraceae bacterium]